MRAAALLAVAALFSACAAPRRVPVVAVPLPIPVPAARRAPAEPAEVQDPNFVLLVSEIVPNPDADGISFTKVFVDGKEAGRTAVGRKSEDRTLRLKLPVGNQPVRLEQWTLPPVGEWIRADDALQPRERFVRVEDGSIVHLELRFSEGEASNALTLSREDARR